MRARAGWRLRRGRGPLPLTCGAPRAAQGRSGPALVRRVAFGDARRPFRLRRKRRPSAERAKRPSKGRAPVGPFRGKPCAAQLAHSLEQKLQMRRSAIQLINNPPLLADHPSSNQLAAHRHPQPPGQEQAPTGTGAVTVPSPKRRPLHTCPPLTGFKLGRETNRTTPDQSYGWPTLAGCSPFPSYGLSDLSSAVNCHCQPSSRAGGAALTHRNHLKPWEFNRDNRSNKSLSLFR